MDQCLENTYIYPYLLLVNAHGGSCLDMISKFALLPSFADQVEYKKPVIRHLQYDIAPVHKRLSILKLRYFMHLDVRVGSTPSFSDRLVRTPNNLFVLALIMSVVVPMEN